MRWNRTMAAVGAALALACSPPEQRQELELGHVADPVAVAQTTGQGSAWDAISARRPEWLDGTRETRVYLVLRCTELTCLRWLETDLVERINYKSEANGSAAIAVYFKTREPIERPQLATRE
ncbi:MAG: hypothetical protein OEN00_15360 [Gemmatimonadota bacterium]|nr:hypothetical protein [Gemmatimonadota bacterium]